MQVMPPTPSHPHHHEEAPQLHTGAGLLVLVSCTPSQCRRELAGIATRHLKLRLFTEDNVVPLVGKGLVNVLARPLHPGLAMAASQDVAPEWPVGMQTSRMQAVLDGL